MEILFLNIKHSTNIEFIFSGRFGKLSSIAFGLKLSKSFHKINSNFEVS